MFRSLAFGPHGPQTIDAQPRDGSHEPRFRGAQLVRRPLEFARTILHGVHDVKLSAALTSL